MIKEPPPTIKAQGTIMEILKPSVYRVQLANGHRLTAVMAGSLRLQFVDIQPGALVELEISPYDLSEARILGILNKK